MTGDEVAGFEAEVAVERWPLHAPFTIARGSKTEAVVVVVTLRGGGVSGRGEAVPYARYGETPASVVRALRSGGELEGAAAAALELARLDLAAKQTGRRAREVLGLPEPAPVPILYTIPLADLKRTRAVAEREAWRPVLKLKLGADDDLARVRAARLGAPSARLLVDVNEGWDLARLNELSPALAELGVELIEQPLPARADPQLRGYTGVVPLCADESFRGGADRLEELAEWYVAVNIKVDKAGGLRTALACAERARALGLEVMVGSMVATSLAVAPAVLLAQGADWADLDAPLYLSRDRDPALHFDERSHVHPAPPELWG